MKVQKFIFSIMLLTLLWGSIAPAALAAAPEAVDTPQQVSGVLAPDSNYPILQCTGTGIGGDLADSRGIVFNVSQAFVAAEVRMAATVGGSYSFVAELRRSSGFTGAANYTVNVAASVEVNGSPPYTPVTINFGNVPVDGTETFSLRFVRISGQGILYFETFGTGNAPCANVMETHENNVAVPTERGDPAGFKVLAAGAASPDLPSSWSTPTIDGVVGFNEWDMAHTVPFENGFISVRNDDLRLYILVDVIGDTVNDFLRSRDYFWVAFDVDRDGEITPEVDLLYGTSPTTGNMRYSYFLGPGTLTGLQPSTYSAKAKGFGCFFADGSFTFTSFFPFRFSCNQHVVWEFGIDLDEIDASPGEGVRMGVSIFSPNPAIENHIPQYYLADFSEMIEVSLAQSPFLYILPNPAAIESLETDAIELTQAIQDRQNKLPLVADKTTAARVYVDVNGVGTSQPTKVYLYGDVNGVDLPGSPLAKWHNAPTSINRATLNHTANFQLPTTWDNSGTKTFSSKIKDWYGNEDSSTPFAKSFNTREVPTVWIVPINTGTNASPVLVSNAEIASQESAMEAVYPVKDINFVRKSWEVIGPTTVANTIDELNDYHGMVVLAWILGLIFGGGAPFDLPDQIYGFTPSGGGISDPTWIGQNGYVGRGFRGTSGELTMAHEINHNLDRSASGTWGRHTPFGCGATGPDSAWPYTNDDIQEVGFDTRLPWSDTASKETAIQSNWPDYMSYCTSGKLPTKWVSPYRWEKQYDTFAVPVQARMLELVQEIQPVFYVSGEFHVDGGASLDPLVINDGIPTPDIAQGEYAFEVQNASGGVLSTVPFMVLFEDSEGDPVDVVHFSFQIPAPEGAAKLVLRHGEEILDEVAQSSNAPEVTLIEPNGGETWSGVETITWEGSDADGDDLSYNLFYTPDDGLGWFPVAANLTETSFDVNTADLPGGSQARIMVIASDGFNNAEDQSDATFALETHSPDVDILSPQDDGFVPAGADINLQGSAMDAEDGALPEEQIFWSIDGEDAGTGSLLSVALPNGFHEITLRAVDSDENVGETTHTIFVGYHIFMTTVIRR